MISGVGGEVVCQLTWVGAGAGDALVPRGRPRGVDRAHSSPSVGVGISWPIVVHWLWLWQAVAVIVEWWWIGTIDPRCGVLGSWVSWF